MKAYKRLQRFSTTTLIGGLVAILPLGIVVILFRWIIGLIEKYLRPLVQLLNPDTKLAVILTYVVAVVCIVLIFFFIGLFIQTRIGNIVRNHIENTYLSKIPGYKTARDVVKQFSGDKNAFFSEVVLVDIFDTGTLQTGFVTSEYADYVTIFVPTAPNPTSGMIYHVPRNKVYKGDAAVDVAIKSVISCGAGSTELFEKIKVDNTDKV